MEKSENNPLGSAKNVRKNSLFLKKSRKGKYRTEEKVEIVIVAGKKGNQVIRK